MRYTVYQGIGFVEGLPPPGPTPRTDLRRDRGQLRSLEDIKAALAREVRSRGGNALVGFTYGQKEVGFWRCSLDRVDWYGRGQAAIVTDLSE